MTEQNAKPSRCPRWVKIALAVSLGANLLIVGLAVGMMSHLGGVGGPPRVADAGGAYTAALLPKDRREIGQQLNEHFRDMRKTRSEFLGEYREMLQVLKAEPFDRAAAEAVLSRQSDLADQRRHAGERALLDRLETMTPDERAGFVQRLEAGLARQLRNGK